MNRAQKQKSLHTAVTAARAAGEIMRRNLHAAKKINSATLHDIKLELDVRCQQQIERTLHRADKQIAILGEEGITGDPEAERRWVVDPIDGTVNFTYGIPHACVSIALQRRLAPSSGTERKAAAKQDGYQTVVGVVLDPFCNELYTAVHGGSARLNNRIIRASTRARLGESIISLGFAKDGQSLNRMLPLFNRLIRRVRKMRMMGAAALGIAYVASGRFDAYIEFGLRLWDIAAGGLILECAGGQFWRQPIAGEYTYRLLANNGVLQPKLAEFTR